MFGSVLARGLAAVQGTEAEQKLAGLLYDDNIQVISSLELNQMASYTYHERSIASGKDLCEKILDMIEAVLSKPLDNSTLAVQKALVVLKHILVFGAEKVINASMYLGAYVESLQNYNTAVMAQQGSMGMFLRMKGGAVDKGGPVRQAAQELHMLITNRQQLNFERSTKADPNSLVPVGSQKQAAFVTDDARLEALKRRMQQERMMLTKSNLAKSDSAFGGGYTARDGKAVVGAAHGLDEMIKQAQREKQKFSDEAVYQAPGNNEAAILAAQAEANLQDLLSLSTEYNASNPNAASIAHSVDLLDFASTVQPATSAMGGYDDDLLGTSDWAAPTPTTSGAPSDIFGAVTAAPAAPPLLLASSNDPFGFAASSAPVSAGSTTGFGLASIIPSTITASSTTSVPPLPATPATKPPIAESVDRFAALDALIETSTIPTLASSLAGNTGIVMGSSSNGFTVSQPTPPTLRTLTDFSSLSISAAPVVPRIDTSSLKVSQLGGGAIGNDDGDDDNGFVMGGTVGAGLSPLGPAPAVPPPPPPPGGFY